MRQSVGPLTLTLRSEPGAGDWGFGVETKRPPGSPRASRRSDLASGKLAGKPRRDCEPDQIPGLVAPGTEGGVTGTGAAGTAGAGAELAPGTAGTGGAGGTGAGGGGGVVAEVGSGFGAVAPAAGAGGAGAGGFVAGAAGGGVAGASEALAGAPVVEPVFMGVS